MAKRKINWKGVIPLGVLAALVLYLLISLVVSLFPHEKTPEIYTICNLNSKKTLKLIEEENRAEPVEVSDYLVYGESLDLFYEPYNMKMDMADQKIVLLDLCTAEETVFEIGSKVDQGIQIGKLTPGFYSVYVREGETDKRVYMSTNLYTNNVFYGVARDGKRTKVEMLASRSLFDAEGQTESVLDRTYLYLKVTYEEVTELTLDYDVAISTAPAIIHERVTPYGEQANGIGEAQELYSLAEEVKKILEGKGLRVKLLKDSYDENPSYYGLDGIAYRAYKSNAKYMIHLDMTTDTNAIQTFYSSYVSSRFVSELFSRLEDAGIYSDVSQMKSSGRTSVTVDEVQYQVDDTWEVRETGGRALMAGAISQTSRENASFAAQSYTAPNMVELVMINIKNAKQVEAWKANRSNYANAIAEGIMATINN